MPPYTVVVTDFGEPDWDLESQVLQASGLDLNLIRLEAKAPEQLILQVASADALIVQWANINSKVIEAMPHCLVDRVIAGAALDVLEQEPPDPSEPLLQLDNLITTPHTSSWSRESIIQLRRGTAQNVVDVLQDRLPRSVVNRKALGL